MKPVILDVDTGIDDAIAIILALASHKINLLGITTVSGNVDVEKATRNTKRILKFLNREDIEVHKGSGKPLVRPLVDASEVHGRTGLANQLEDIVVEEELEETALQFLEEKIIEYAGEITIITTGPQTNIAHLLTQKPDLSAKINALIMMGGVVDGRGNHTPVAEFNILTDPESAKIVFKSSVKNKTLVGLDVTRKALLKKEDLSKIKDPILAGFIEKLTEKYMRRHFNKWGEYACPMHDPLTILYFLEPNILKTILKYVTVETNSTYCDGMTVCDFDNHWNNMPNINVAIEIDENLFKEQFIELINNIKIEEIK